MNSYKLYAYPTHEADEKEREKMMFNTPYFVPILEGVPDATRDIELACVAILSSN